MKRLLSAVLSFAMMLSMVAGMSITVRAAELTMITEVELLNVPTAVVGGTATTEGLSVSAGSHYTLCVEGWGVHQGEQAVYFSGTFEAGKRYVLMLSLDPDDGYAFAEDVTVPAGASARVLDTGVLELRYEFDLRQYEDSVDITGIPKAVAGATITTEGITVAEGDHAAIGPDTSWQIWDESNWTNVENGGTFKAGKKYRVTMQIVAKDGWLFSDGVTVTVDGKTNGEVSGYVGEQVFLYNTDETRLDFHYINEVEINYDLPAVGAAPSTFKLPDDANYVVSESGWVDMDTGEAVATFADGGRYQMQVTVIPKDEYIFGDLSVWVNGEPKYGSNLDKGREKVSLVAYYHFCEELAAADVICAKPEAGKTMPVPSVPEDANYTIENYTWYGELEPNATAVAGRQYSLEVMIKPKQGYVFRYSATIKINGALPQYSRVDSTYDDWGDTAVASKIFDLRTPIDKVEISFPTPEIGKEPPKVTVANEEQYSDWNAEWGYATGHESLIGPFQKGGIYKFGIDLQTAEGYCFSERVEIYINGKLYGGDHLKIEPECVRFTHLFDFCEPISAVDFPVWPEYKVGDSIPDAATITSEDGSYTIHVVMYKKNDMSSSHFSNASGTFEEGETYRYQMVAVPNEGYKFAENVAVTQNGKEVVGRVPGNPYEEDKIMLMSHYSFGNVKIIDNIELTVDGIEIGTTPGHVSVPKDAGYTRVFNVSWRVCKNGRYQSSITLKNTFQEGDCPILTILIIPLDNATIDLGAKVTVNGKQAQVIDVQDNPKEQFIVFTIMLDPLTSDDEEEIEPTETTEETTESTEGTTESTTESTTETTAPNGEKNPTTGDSSQIHILVILLLISVCGIYAVFAAKKYKRV